MVVCYAAALIVGHTLNVGCAENAKEKALDVIIRMLRRLTSRKPNGRAKHTKGVNPQCS